MLAAAALGTVALGANASAAPGDRTPRLFGPYVEQFDCDNAETWAGGGSQNVTRHCYWAQYGNEKGFWFQAW